MISLRLEIGWSVDPSGGEVTGPMLFRLLDAVQTSGSLAKSAPALGLSYRHLWGLLGRWEKAIGRPLVRLERGRGAKLTEFAEKLVWADRTARARLAGQIEAVQIELERALTAEISRGATALVMYASHDLALAHLRDLLQEAGGPVLQLEYHGSLESLDALARGLCDVAGFHLPEGGLETDFFFHRRAFKARDHVLIRCATRTQGLMLASGNPKGITGLSDLTRPNVRLVNRQPGSGSRAELDQLLREAGIDSASVAGYETTEFTHLAVAATIASGMADTGFGLEAAARQHGLGFIPLLRERYYLACRSERVVAESFQALIKVLRSDDFFRRSGNLAGYDWTGAGEILSAEAVFAVRPGSPRGILRPEAKPARAITGAL